MEINPEFGTLDDSTMQLAASRNGEVVWTAPTVYGYQKANTVQPIPYQYQDNLPPARKLNSLPNVPKLTWLVGGSLGLVLLVLLVMSNLSSKSLDFSEEGWAVPPTLAVPPTASEVFTTTTNTVLSTISLTTVISANDVTTATVTNAVATPTDIPITPSPIPTTVEPTATPLPSTVAVKTGKLNTTANLRSKAVSTSQVLRVLKKGDKVTLLGGVFKSSDGSEWYKVTVGNQTGWVGKKYIDVL
jgi:hypothetical protein